MQLLARKIKTVERQINEIILARKFKCPVTKRLQYDPFKVLVELFYLLVVKVAP